MRQPPAQFFPEHTAVQAVRQVQECDIKVSGVQPHDVQMQVPVLLCLWREVEQQPPLQQPRP